MAMKGLVQVKNPFIPVFKMLKIQLVRKDMQIENG